MAIQAVNGDIERVRYQGAYGEDEKVQGEGRIGHCEVSICVNTCRGEEGEEVREGRDSNCVRSMLTGGAG